MLLKSAVQVFARIPNGLLEARRGIMSPIGVINSTLGRQKVG